MKFVMSYSGGKDSILSLHRLIKSGHTPIALIVMYNEEMKRSWFHGIDDDLLDKISLSLQIPVWKSKSVAKNYRDVMLQTLKQAKEKGADFVAFGDIDIEEHRDWYLPICKEAGLTAEFPLWKEDREKLVRETVELGYRCVIKCVSNEKLGQEFLGKALSDEVLSAMKEKGVDLCGENGEYHTVVLDGPLFSFPIETEVKEIIDFGKISAINLVLSRSGN